MKRVICHGSEYKIEQPYWGGGKKRNDYGKGFYCTEEPDMAREWSVTSGHDGYINIYDIEEEGIQILNLTDDCYTVMNWMAVLLENRTFDVSSALSREGRSYMLENFLPEYQDSDVMIGYRADDSYFSFAQDFLNGTISVRQLQAAMKLGKLGLQYVVRSQEAFGRLRFRSAEKVPAETWYARRMTRDRLARNKYLSMDRSEWHRGDLYMPMILDSEVKNDDPRLR